MKAKMKPKYIWSLLILAFLAVSVTYTGCRSQEVEVPPLTGPSGARLFITIQANPDHLVIHAPGRPRETSQITIQLKNQQGQGVPGEGIKLRIVNRDGVEINVGTLSAYNVTTDAAGFARVIYTAPNTAEQPFPTMIRILAILQNPAYPFEVTGSHQIDLERSGVEPQPNDCIFGSPGAPEAEFTAQPPNPVVGETVCFDAQGTTDPNGDFMFFFWDFGDRTKGEGAVVCHEYNSVGSFTATLLVVDQEKACDTASQVIVVEQGSAPTCSIVFSPSEIEVGDTVNFTAIATDPDNHRIRRYEWNFGDGSTAKSSRNTITHRYNEAATFTVILRVVDETNLAGFCQTTVTVAPLPQCSDGEDNDGDGNTDFPADPECTNAEDDDESA